MMDSAYLMAIALHDIALIACGFVLTLGAVLAIALWYKLKGR